MNISELMYDLEECKLEIESVLWEIVCDKRGVESVEDLDDRLLLVECMDDFYGDDNWELFKWWMELEEVFMWLYDLSNEQECDRGTYNGSSIIFFQSAGNARSDE